MSGVRVAVVAFVLSTLASLGLAVTYVLGGQPQVEGVLLGVALGGVAVGLVGWAKHLMPTGPFTQDRAVTPHEGHAREDVGEAFEEGEELIGRRTFFVRLIVTSLGAFGVAALFPIRSLGTAPGRELFHTSWRRGSRAVTDAGNPIRPGDIPVDGVLTVFPDGAVGSEDSQTLLIRLPAGLAVNCGKEVGRAQLHIVVGDVKNPAGPATSCTDTRRRCSLPSTAVRSPNSALRTAVA